MPKKCANLEPVPCAGHASPLGIARHLSRRPQPAVHSPQLARAAAHGHVPRVERGAARSTCWGRREGGRVTVQVDGSLAAAMAALQEALVRPTQRIMKYQVTFLSQFPIFSAK